MAATSEDLGLLDQLAEDFVGRIRRGERPTIQSYAEQRPKLAAEIQRLFPTLVAMENISSTTATTRTEFCHTSIPDRIGDYRILRQIGEGGMGVVYEAIQESLSRHVALKVLPASAHASERQRERFRVEARAAARLHHPHIVPVFGVGEHVGVMYYAMQFISGRGLDELLKPRDEPVDRHAETITLAAPADTAVVPARVPKSLPPGPVQPDQVHWAAEIAAQVADALAYAHSEGVIHRDIKPSNLILDDRGSVWVTDFGLAKTTDTGGLTEPGDIVGTIRYMAPERFSGWSDVRSDIYGLGATLFEILTRRPMYEDPDRGKLIHAILNSDPPRPRKLNRAIPHDLETIVLKSTAREPGHRYQSAEELAGDLRRFSEGRPILARRQSLVGYAWSWCRRKPVAAGMASAVALLLLVLLAGSLIVNVRLDGQNRQIVDQNQEINDTHAALREQLHQTNAARGREAEANVKARRQLMLALRREAEAARWSRRPGSRGDALEAVRQLTELARSFPMTPDEILEVRNLAIAVSAQMDVVPESLEAAEIPAQAIFSQDFGHYHLRDDSKISIHEYPSQRLVAQLPIGSVNSHIFVPDGRHMIVGVARYKGVNKPAFIVWDWRANKIATEIISEAGPAYYDVSPDGKEIALAYEDGTLAFHAAVGGGKLRSVSIRGGVRGLLYSPLGNRIAVHRRTRQLEILNVSDGKVQKVLPTPSETGIMAMAWSHDGRMIAAGCANYRAHVWHTENGQLAADLIGHQAEVTQIVFDPNGAWVATGGWDEVTRIWNPVTGTQLLSLRGSLAAVAPDGRRVVHVQGHQTRMLQVKGEAEFLSLHGHVGAKGPWQVSFGPDSRVLASSNHDGVRFWDATTGRHAGDIRPYGGALATLFHPQGQYLLTAGRHHVSRWPTKYDRTTNTLDIGVEEPMLAHQADPMIRAERRVSMSNDGRRIAVSNQSRQSIYVFAFDEPKLWRSIRAFPELQGGMLSPDGRWIFGSSWPTPSARIWDALTGEAVKDFKSLEATCFSPDSKRLAIGSRRGGQILEVGTWKPLATIPPDVSGPAIYTLTYSADGRLLCLVRASNVIQLLDADTLREVARLEAPDPQGVSAVAFSADGGRLAAVATTHVVQLWDLRQIRARLSDLGLDWDHPSIPEEEKPSRSLEVRVAGK